MCYYCLLFHPRYWSCRSCMHCIRIIKAQCNTSCCRPNMNQLLILLCTCTNKSNPILFTLTCWGIPINYTGTAKLYRQGKNLYYPTDNLHPGALKLISILKEHVLQILKKICCCSSLTALQILPSKYNSIIT